MRAIIIDDEQHCREGLSIMLKKYCEGVELETACSDGPSGIAAIEKHHPDLVFLDIEMPGMNGFEMLQQCINCDFKIIFTTAYNEYAIQAIRHSALDYLLKPVSKAELVQAVERARMALVPEQSAGVGKLLSMLAGQKDKGKIALPTMEGLLLVEVSDILYCESESAYTKFYFTDKKSITVSKVLKDAEALLEGKGFFRAHNSYLINLQYVQRYIRGNGGEVIMADGKNIPVSRTRRQDFLNRLEKL
jgi:two-component system LytT family response regulator